jgi:GT2 family glycosyltransferase
VTIRPTLCVVPALLSSAADVDALLRCLVSLQATAPDAAILVVDDASPEPELVAGLELACEQLGVGFVANDETSGLAATINAGLGAAHAMEHDAVLVSPYVEFPAAGWLERMRERTDTEDRPAAVVGARLVKPNGLLRHAGIFLSLLTRDWVNRFQHGPHNLPEALTACRCPVTSALQLIRWETLDQIGFYDEGYIESLGDVDYCLRVFRAGSEVIYEPSAVAFDHKVDIPPAMRSAELKQRLAVCKSRMWRLWASEDLARWVPEVL